MKATYFLLSADQKSYNLLFKKLRDEDHICRYEYTITIMSTMDPLIYTEGSIYGNQTLTHENCSGRGGSHPKGRMGDTFAQQRQGVTE